MHAGYPRLQTHTHTEYALLIDFPLQQRLHERASAIRDSTLSVLLWNMKYMLLEYIYKNAQTGQGVSQQ